MIFPCQIRAARALLGISQTQLAERSSISIATIKRVETAKGGIRTAAQTIWRLQKTLEEEGVLFIEQDETSGGPGVRLKTLIGS